MKRKIAAGLAALLLLCLLTGCAPKQAAEVPQESAPLPEEARGDLVICLGDAPRTLDPQSAVDTGDPALMRLLYEGLTKPDPAGGWTLGAAESYALSEDKRTCTFTLRADALWSDGSAVTAEDFVYAWRLLLDPKSDSPFAMDAALWIEGGEAFLYGEPDAELGVRALDERTLEVHLTAPCPYLDALLALPALSPLREGAQNATNGPFVLAAQGEDGWTLRRSEHYRDYAAAETLELRFYDEAEAVRAFRAGELDICLPFPETELDALREEGDLCRSAEDTILFLDINCAQPPFDDARVRRAFALAADPVAALREADLPGWTAATGLSQDGLCRMDEDAARQSLAEAGYPDGEGFPEATLLITEAERGLAEALCIRWRDVLGVSVLPVMEDAEDIVQARLDGDFVLARAVYLNAYGDAQALWDLELNLAYWALEDEQAAALLAQAKGAEEEGERLDALEELERLALEEGICIPLARGGFFWLAQPDVEGAVYTPAGELLLQGAHRAAK